MKRSDRLAKLEKRRTEDAPPIIIITSSAYPTDAIIGVNLGSDLFARLPGEPMDDFEARLSEEVVRRGMPAAVFFASYAGDD